MDLFTRLTVCDFLLEKDPLFARLTLSAKSCICINRYTTRSSRKPRSPIWSSTSRRSRRSCTNACAGAA